MQDLFDHRDFEAEIESHIDGAYADTMPLIPCDAVGAYNFERVGRDRYCLTLAVPGFEEDDIEILARDGYMRILGNSRHVTTVGDVLHRGLNGKLDHTFLMTRPLEVVEHDVLCGLLKVVLRDHPGAGVRTVTLPRLQGVEALALAA